jgi:hypothetical protein
MFYTARGNAQNGKQSSQRILQDCNMVGFVDRSGTMHA